MLEVGMVDIAAKRINDSFLKSLWWCIEEMKKNIDHQDAFISSGIRFHRLIAEIGQNEVLILVWDMLANLIRKEPDQNIPHPLVAQKSPRRPQEDLRRPRGERLPESSRGDETAYAGRRGSPYGFDAKGKINLRRDFKISITEQGKEDEHGKGYFVYRKTS